MEAISIDQLAYTDREKHEKGEKSGPSIYVEAISIDQLAYRDREKHEKGEKSGPSV